MLSFILNNALYCVVSLAKLFIESRGEKIREDFLQVKYEIISDID